MGSDWERARYESPDNSRRHREFPLPAGSGCTGCTVCTPKALSVQPFGPMVPQA